MTDPLKPSPAFLAGKTGLSQGWQTYLSSLFVKDSVAPLLNSSVAVNSFMSPPLGHPNVRGNTTATGGITLFETPSDQLFTHEVGHALELQDQASEITTKVRALFEQQRPSSYRYANRRPQSFDAYGHDAGEYVAESFRTAMQIARAPKDKQQEQLQAAEKVIPGTSLWYDWIQSRWSHRSSETPPEKPAH